MASASLISGVLTPVSLAFLLGLAAAAIKSELRLADSVHAFLSTFLLLAIGLKGGVGIAQSNASELLLPIGAALLLGIITPLVAWAIFSATTSLDSIDKGALAAHYGSTSLVTFTAALTWLQAQDLAIPGFMPTLLAVMEVPGIVVGLLLALRHTAGATQPQRSLKPALREVFTSKSIVLLVGGLVIGSVIGKDGYEPIAPVFSGLFQGILVLFLLDLGVIAGKQLTHIKKQSLPLIASALILPLINGALGVTAGYFIGLDIAGSTLLGVLAGSASYIAAPAAVRLALPRANPGYYLTASLGVTFPFNLLLGIPLLLMFARWIH